MAYNKIVYSGNTLIDLTSDTVSEETLVEGVIAHNAKGEQIVGTMAKPTVSDDGNGNVTIAGLTAVVN